MWRNWQTRTFKGRVIIHVGSSPTVPTKLKTTNSLVVFLCQSIYWHHRFWSASPCCWLRHPRKLCLLTHILCGFAPVILTVPTKLKTTNSLVVFLCQSIYWHHRFWSASPCCWLRTKITLPFVLHFLM